MNKPASAAKPNRKLAATLRMLRKAEKDDRFSDEDKQVFTTIRSRAESVIENFDILLTAGVPAGGKFGLAVQLRVTEESRQISFSLDTLSKEEVIEHIKDGGLYEEIMTLFRLALLPGTDFFTLNVHLPDLDFDIIDRVYLNLDETFHPTRKKRPENILDILAQHAPYNKIRKVEKGLCWLRERKDRR